MIVNTHDNSSTILVSGGVLSSQAHLSALNYVSSLLRDHTSPKQAIKRVFFYAEAAAVANTLMTPLSDELNPTEAWQALQQEFDLDLSVCIASAERRGVIGVDSAEDHALDQSNLAEGFRIVGLAELHDAMLQSARTVRFT